MIKAVIFDIDGVLLDSKEANTVGFQNLIENAGYKRLSKKEAEKAFSMTLWDGIKRLTKKKAEKRRIFDMAASNRTSWYPFELVKTPKGARETIKHLRRHYKLAIVTSRIKEGVEDFHKILGMRKYFDVVVKFGDFSRPKPDPEPLLIAIEKLEVRPSEAIYIGDSMSDMVAAKAARIKIIAYSRKPMKYADITIKHFLQLLPAITKLSER